VLRVCGHGSLEPLAFVRGALDYRERLGWWVCSATDTQSVLVAEWACPDGRTSPNSEARLVVFSGLENAVRSGVGPGRQLARDRFRATKAARTWSATKTPFLRSIGALVVYCNTACSSRSSLLPTVDRCYCYTNDLIFRPGTSCRKAGYDNDRYFPVRGVIHRHMEW
jgi:hypothetical protein